MGNFIKAMLPGIGFVWLTTFAGTKASGKRLAGICVEGDIFPQGMSGSARRTAKDTRGAHGENEFAVGIRVAG
ncbi:hypothetical protein KYE064_01320 [Escherichia coli]|nr:hypothetical protein Esc0902E_24210 [Escherichia coli]BDS39919.1 hypothetical protein MY017_15580 [Escherichia coli]GDU49764.1 hypothetical protein ExPUPEC61_01480 [Escherichia coli]